MRNNFFTVVIARRASARRSNLLQVCQAVTFWHNSGDCFVVPTGLPRNDTIELISASRKQPQNRHEKIQEIEVEIQRRKCRRYFMSILQDSGSIVKNKS